MKNSVTLAFCVGLSSGFFTCYSLADANESEKITEEVFVTGELIERSKQNSLTSVAVVDPNEVERTLQDTMNRLANVLSDGFDERFVIRGIAYDGVGFAGEGQTISVDVDGVPVDNWAIRTGWSNFWDMEQIEILRGPQSTSQGRNALAGAVVMRSVRPSFEYSGKARAVLGSDETYGIAVAQGGSLVDNVLAFRFAGETETSRGFINNPTFDDDEYGNYERALLRASLLIQPTGSEDLKIVPIISYFDSEVGENSVNRDDDPFDFENTSGFPNAITNANEVLSTSVDVSWIISDKWDFNSLTTYKSTDYFTRTGFDTVPENTSERRRDAEVESYTQDFRLSYQSDSLSGVVGLYFSYFDEEENFGGTLPAALLELPPPYETFTIDARAPNTETNIAIFTEWDIQLSEKWHLIGGLRIDNEKRERTTESDNIAGPEDPFGISADNDPVSADTSFDVVLPKIGVRFDQNDNVSYGFQVQRGYRSGGTDIDLLTAEVNEFDPEFTNNAEMSVRSQWFDQRLRIDGNIFYTDWQDQQVSVLVSPDSSLTRTVNAGESELYGAELEVSGYLDNAKTLDVFLSVGLLNTEFVEFDEENASGNKFPRSADESLGAGLRYAHPSGFFGGFDFAYVGEREGDVENSPSNKMDAYTVMNLRLGLETESWRVTAYGNNLFDEEYEYEKNAITITPGRPFQAGVSAEIFW